MGREVIGWCCYSHSHSITQMLNPDTSLLNLKSNASAHHHAAVYSHCMLIFVGNRNSISLGCCLCLLEVLYLQYLSFDFLVIIDTASHFIMKAFPLSLPFVIPIHIWEVVRIDDCFLLALLTFSTNFRLTPFVFDLTAIASPQDSPTAISIFYTKLKSSSIFYQKAHLFIFFAEAFNFLIS